MNSIINSLGFPFFLHSGSGCGKTYLAGLIAASVHARGEIVLCAASTGLASLLLPGGHTAIHASKFPFLSMNRVHAILKKMILLINSFSRPLLSSGMKQVINTISLFNLLIVLYVTCSTKIAHLEELLSCLVETSDKLYLSFSMD